MTQNFPSSVKLTELWATGIMLIEDYFTSGQPLKIGQVNVLHFILTQPFSAVKKADESSSGDE